ncbi:hypothetical protein BT93_B2138 [Corymbia citriodora subsp. variegata]|nr:hypothetical protein BT93_B2138 [Corymbia citriodora subsp. variegata]
MHGLSAIGWHTGEEPDFPRLAYCQALAHENCNLESMSISFALCHVVRSQLRCLMRGTLSRLCSLRGILDPDDSLVLMMRRCFKRVFVDVAKAMAWRFCFDRRITKN